MCLFNAVLTFKCSPHYEQLFQTSEVDSIIASKDNGCNIEREAPGKGNSNVKDIFLEPLFSFEHYLTRSKLYIHTCME